MGVWGGRPSEAYDVLLGVGAMDDAMLGGSVCSFECGGSVEVAYGWAAWPAWPGAAAAYGDRYSGGPATPEATDQGNG